LRIDFGTGRSEILMARQTHLFSFSPAAAAAAEQQQRASKQAASDDGVIDSMALNWLLPLGPRRVISVRIVRMMYQILTG
jgi:hypothetical protein